MSLTCNTVAISTTSTSSNNIISTPSATPNTITIYPNNIEVSTVQSHTVSTGDFCIIPEYYLSPKIVDINVYGHDKPKVVEVEFRFEYDTKKIKSICCDEDEFDLKKGVYIAMSKLLYGDIYTTEGIEEKAHELSLKKDNEKMVNKAIKDYYKKLKTEEEAKKKSEEEKLSKLRRKEKNRARRQKRKERSLNDLAELIKKATK